MSTDTCLTTAHEAQLIASAIHPHVIAQRGYRSIRPGAAKEVREITGGAFSQTLLRTVLHQGALLIPLYRLGAPTPYTWVLRPDMPRTDANEKPVKYEYPRGVSNVFDVLPDYRSALGDPTIPIWLTEGAKKADALASTFGAAIVPVNLNGVYGWRGRSTQGGKVAAPDMDEIAWEGRQVVIAPDGDVKENRNVLHAVQRLGRLLTAKHGIAELLVCYLPQSRGGAKLGVDDYLAQGHTRDALESYLVPLAAASIGARIGYTTHTNGEKLFLPAGYDVRDQAIYQVDELGKARRLYSGGICVTDTGVDLETCEHTATIAWNGRGDMHGSATVPYAALSDGRSFSTLVGAAGAALGPQNLKPVMQFLVEFIQENRAALPHQAHADRLGLVHDGLVTPAGAVGFAEPVRYIGRPTVNVGTDGNAYPNAVRAMHDWSDAWVAWLVLGLGLAAPAIARLRLRRNPVLYLSGASGSGKTTLAQFATGCWGDPSRHPFRIESGRTTPAGIFQTLESLGGLPALVDEAHTVPDPKRLEMACYGFANGQRYTTGGVDGKARGGEALSGALLLAGEALPDFKHAGSRLRVLWVDSHVSLPLGAEARTVEGATRAAVLEHAWETGAGLFGHAVADALWKDWHSYVNDVRAVMHDESLAPLGPWREPLAAAAVALNVAFRRFDIRAMPTLFDSLLSHWAGLLTAGQADTDPAADAWEALITMLAQGRRRDDADADPHGVVIPDSAQWDYIEADRGGGVIACRKIGEPFWRVLTSSPQFKERVGATAVQLYGQTWLKRALVQPASDGKATDTMRIYPTGVVRVLKVPESALERW